jgi:acyl-CoA synthetase (AMP-forming)/AMP-acid ligase II
VNLATFLTDTAARRPDHIAIRFKDHTVTYSELNRRVDSLAWGLSTAGLRPADVCVLMMPNSIEWVTAYYALAKLGAVVLPVNFLYRVGELEHIFRHSRARAFIGDSAHLSQASKVMAGLPELDIRVADGEPVAGFRSLPVEVLRAFESQFKAIIYEGYGLTECSPVCVENPYDRPTRPGSIGLPIPGFEARLVDETDHDVDLGNVGELIVRGPGVMKGYLRQPEATEQTLHNGWLHTGDMARQDDDGYIYIVDRKKDMVIRGGYNVYPREIEELLYSHPAVSEAAVLGVPHPDLGEEVAAVVALLAGANATADEIRAFVKERVAPYKYPRLIRFSKELPKSATGKILKRAISVDLKESSN